MLQVSDLGKIVNGDGTTTNPFKARKWVSGSTDIFICADTMMLEDGRVVLDFDLVEDFEIDNFSYDVVELSNSPMEARNAVATALRWLEARGVELQVNTLAKLVEYLEFRVNAVPTMLRYVSA